jgi:hypothetical protein
MTITTTTTTTVAYAVQLVLDSIVAVRVFPFRELTQAAAPAVGPALRRTAGLGRDAP